MESYENDAGKHATPVTVLSHLLVYREQKHRRPKLDHAHVPRGWSRARLILHQWESHHSNQVPVISLGGWRERETEKNKVLT